MLFKILGGAIIAWALTDFVMSLAGTDVWLEWLGVQLPELLYRVSALVEGFIGGVIWNFGSDSEVENIPE